MTIKKAFVNYMANTLSLGIVGTDIFIGSIPKNAQKKGWWVVGGGGSPTTRASTGEKIKSYLLSVYYRNTDSEDVDEVLQAFEHEINSKQCTQLEGFDTIEMEATGFQSDQDIDADDRTVGLVQVTISVYQSE